MSCCNCGCNSNPCKNLNISDIAKLEFVQGVDENGCPKYENISTLFPVVHPAATLTNNAAPFAWNVATQTGNVPQASRLVANADGSFTFIRGDGSPNVVIPKDCCPTMTQSGNTITFTNGDGSVVTFTLHPAATLTNNAAPFSWNAVTQSGNVPQASRLVANADGSFTFTPGDGSPSTVIPKDCCPTMSMSGNTVTFTNGDGSVITFTLHPAATLTNNAAPFAWNAATQTGNVPQSPTLTLTPTGFLFVPGNGSAPTVYTDATGSDTFVTGFSIVGNQATITRSDGVTFTQTIPTTVDINVQSFSLSGSNLVLTETDGTVHTVPLPQANKVVAVSYTPGNGTITITNSDGTNVSTTIDVCATLAVLPNGTAGVAGVSQFLGKDCEWHTLPTSSVTAKQVQIETAFDGLLTGYPNVEDALQGIDNWQNQVINPGASLPIADVADAGAKPLLVSGTKYYAETNDIIPKIDTSGTLNWYKRSISAKFTAPTGQMIPPNNTEVILFPNTEYNTAPSLITALGGGQFQYNGSSAKPFLISTRMMFKFVFPWNWVAFGSDPEYSATAVYLFRNGGAWNRLWNVSQNKNDLAWANNDGYLSPQGTTTILLNPGDIVSVGLYNTYSVALPLFSATASGRFDTYFDICAL